MIIPVLNGIRWLKEAPMTWVLFFINLCFYLYTAQSSNVGQAKLEEHLENAFFLDMQGKVFSQFIHHHPTAYSQLMRKMSDLAEAGDGDKQKILGYLSVRDALFVKEGGQFPYTGDQVAYFRWQSQFEELKKLQLEHPSYIFGLNVAPGSVFRWITYQFIHGGFWHLLMNMWFLLIFGCLLEPRIGSGGLLVLYLFAGAVGAFVFVTISGISLAPLVGASGSISGLMGLFSILYWKRRVRFFYCVLPVKGYNGLVYLPGWVVLLLFGLSDLRGYFETVPEIGGVAHMAHLGGTVSGFVAAFFFLMVLRLSKYRRSALGSF